MGIAKHTFNTIMCSGAAVATFFVLSPPNSQDDTSLSDSFTTQVDPPPSDLKLVLAMPNGTERTFTDPAEMRRALDQMTRHATEESRLEMELRTLTANDPVSYTLMRRLAESESGFDANAVSSENARGILQFMPLTQLEQLYLNRELLPEPYRTIAGDVEEYAIGSGVGYRVKEGADAERVFQTAHEPIVGFILGREYVRTIAQILKENLDRQLTYTDIKAAYVFGASGATPLLRAYSNPATRNNRALDYINPVAVAGNPGLFYANPKARSGPRSVEWLYNHFQSKMGSDLVPDDLTPPPDQQLVASVVQGTTNQNRPA